MEERLEGTESREEYEADNEAENKQRILREMSLESAGGSLVPDRAQRKLMIA